MYKLTIIFVLIGLLFVEMGRSEFKIPSSKFFSKNILKKAVYRPKNCHEEVEIRQTNAQLAAAIASAAQYFSQQQFPFASPALPADLVSVALAYQQPQIGYQTVKEDGLAYGFTKIPVENPCYQSQVCEATVEEASLHTINGQVMELNQKSSSLGKSNHKLVDPVSSQLSKLPGQFPILTDLGYVPAKKSVDPNLSSF